MSEPVAVKITAKGVLDPRSSALLAMAAVKFKANVTFTLNGRTANAKAMTELMSLCAEQGNVVYLHAQGEDAEQLLNVLLAVIQKNKLASPRHFHAHDDNGFLSFNKSK